MDSESSEESNEEKTGYNPIIHKYGSLPHFQEWLKIHSDILNDMYRMYLNRMDGEMTYNKFCTFVYKHSSGYFFK